VLVPLLTPAGADTHHRITSNAYDTPVEHHRPAYPKHGDAEFQRFFLNELLTLAPVARRRYEAGVLLKVDYDFGVIERKDDVLWIVPNELDGITAVKPEGY
jgi:hypothetical protein